MNMFYHPVYIARSPACRAAIKALLAGIEKRELRAAHMGNDALYAWWEARSRSGIAEWEETNRKLRFRTRCKARGGMVVQVPLGARGQEFNTEARRHGDRSGDDGIAADPTRAQVDGRAAHGEIRWEFGQRWLWLVVPAGDHEVEVDLGAVASPTAA
jgi:hypothetical protein